MRGGGGGGGGGGGVFHLDEKTTMTMVSVLQELKYKVEKL